MTHWSYSEYQEFKEAEGIKPPDHLSKNILDQVRSELNPSPWLVLSKLSLIHFCTALLTLSICPQFGWRLFGSGMGLMHIFMRFGAHACMAACGFFFLGASVLVASMVLRPEELRCIRKHRILEFSTLALLSLCFFIMVNAQVVLSLAAVWFIGSLLGAGLSLELGWIYRTRAVMLRA